ncbi:hypothetical protein BN7_3583 [Wickerhamomyces ciferrii]|uniref:Uncharacterized protein n=1 Tax=Wickerhamomyces ciferrii (strain ATCC 14091 / BCRC 22168 / CBS 111 / JCM 3599 / NBRC 0793 / NRRL Y-1031 F-60-10) TaxID=1206466 RepID=K0KLZ8_WICCF|nr:uncharacterized protein BN7_3583 [Wickerhamomyces ciferrii]CCH44026.1 hypothetical protein BN7_3583 [Wickerhamomyces ciferrii]
MNIINLSKQSSELSAPWKSYLTVPTPKSLISRQIAPPAIQSCLSSRYHKSSITRKVNSNVFSASTDTKDKKATKEEATTFGVFPPELWFEIMNLNDDVGMLVTLNKTFYHTFSPQIYGKFESLILLLVISSTKQMKLNDEIFMSKVGIEFKDKLSQCYKICERQKEGAHYDYEYIDVGTTKDYSNIDGFESKKIITSHKKIESLFKHILPNDQLTLTKSIKSISLDISILDGYHDLIGSKGSNLKQDLKKSKKMNGVFEQSIRLPRVNVDNGVGYVPTSDEPSFPEKVYTTELTHLNRVFDYINSNKRQNMTKFINYDDLNSKNPFDFYLNYCSYKNGSPLILSNFQYCRILRNFEEKSQLIKILNRNFASKSQVNDLLHQIIETMTMTSSSNSSSSIDTSLLIIGFDYGNENFEESYKRERRRSITSQKPIMTLLNKSPF